MCGHVCSRVFMHLLMNSPFLLSQHAVSEQYRSQTLTEDQGKVLGSNLAQTISLARVGRAFTANSF